MNRHFTEEDIQMPTYTCKDAKLQMVMRDTKENHKETPLYKHRNSHNFYMISAKYEQDCGVMALSATPVGNINWTGRIGTLCGCI